MEITTDQTDTTEEQPLLRRPHDRAMLAGVAAGLADYFAWT